MRWRDPCEERGGAQASSHPRRGKSRTIFGERGCLLGQRRLAAVDFVIRIARREEDQSDLAFVYALSVSLLAVVYHLQDYSSNNDPGTF